MRRINYKKEKAQLEYGNNLTSQQNRTHNGVPEMKII